MQILYRLTIAVALAMIAGCSSDRNHAHPSGTLEATEVDIAAELSLRIIAVRADLGAAVHAGDTLIVLDTRLIELQKEQAEAARGSIIAQTQVASGAVTQARDNLELAETTLNRTESLLEQGSTTRQQVDELRAKRDAAKTALASAGHSLEGLEAEMKKLDATLRVYDRQLEMGTILSPMNGTILLRNAEPGEMALPGQTLLKLGEIDNMELRVYLGETELDLVRIGERYPVLVDALAGDTLSGVLSWISAEAEFTPKNAQTRQARTQLVYAVKLRLPNADHRLAIGMPGELVLPGEK